MTYRERREARANRLRGWAAKRETDAAAALKQGEQFRGDYAFNTQPGHIPERARLIAREARAYESQGKARGMAAKADEIDRQADNAIYMDDDDATERLTTKLEALEAQRERIKAINKACKKLSQEQYDRLLTNGEGEPELSDNERASLISNRRAFGTAYRPGYPPYVLTNLGGTIRKEKQRLAKVRGERDPGECANCNYKKGYHDRGYACDNYEPTTGPRPKAVKVILCRYAGTCGDCHTAIDKGAQAIHVERGVIACYPECST